MVMVEPARFALTSTPSIGPSSDEVTCPVSTICAIASSGNVSAASKPRIKLRIDASHWMTRIPLPNARYFNALPGQFGAVVIHVAMPGFAAVLLDRICDIAAGGFDIECRRRPAHVGAHPTGRDRQHRMIAVPVEEAARAHVQPRPAGGVSLPRAVIVAFDAAELRRHEGDGRAGLQ